MENEKRTRLQRGTGFLSMLTLDQEQIEQVFTHLTYFLSTYYVPCTKMSVTNPVLPLVDLTIPRTFISPTECSCLWISSSNCSCRRGNRTLLDLYSLRGYFCLTKPEDTAVLLLPRRDIWHISLHLLLIFDIEHPKQATCLCLCLYSDFPSAKHHHYYTL